MKYNMKFLTVKSNLDHMRDIINVNNIVNIRYNSLSKCLYCYMLNNKVIEITDISEEEFNNISDFLGADVN